MSFLKNLTEGTVTGFFKGVGSFAKDVRAAITGEEAMTSEQKAQMLERVDMLEAAAEQREQELAMGQQEITKIEAQSASLFKSGWRPALGWACVAGIFYQFVLAPICSWLVKIAFLIHAVRTDGLTDGAKEIMDAAVDFPTLDVETLIGLIVTLLGAGTWRMFEKKWRVASK